MSRTRNVAIDDFAWRSRRRRRRRVVDHGETNRRSRRRACRAADCVCRSLRRAIQLFRRRRPSTHRARVCTSREKPRLAAILDARRPRAEDARQRGKTVEHQFLFLERFGKRVDGLRHALAEHARAADRCRTRRGAIAGGGRRFRGTSRRSRFVVQLGQFVMDATTVSDALPAPRRDCRTRRRSTWQTSSERPTFRRFPSGRQLLQIGPSGLDHGRVDLFEPARVGQARAPDRKLIHQPRHAVGGGEHRVVARARRRVDRRRRATRRAGRGRIAPFPPG